MTRAGRRKSAEGVPDFTRGWTRYASMHSGEGDVTPLHAVIGEHPDLVVRHYRVAHVHNKVPSIHRSAGIGGSSWACARGPDFAAGRHRHNSGSCMSSTLRRTPFERVVFDRIRRSCTRRSCRPRLRSWPLRRDQLHRGIVPDRRYRRSAPGLPSASPTTASMACPRSGNRRRAVRSCAATDAPG